ncbi:MAG: hypothetical protein ACR2RV_18970 [Verrucomicrobiales bacterium]
MLKSLFALGLVIISASCSSLPRPVVSTGLQSDPSAEQILRESSRKSGDPYQRLGRVDVEYDGKWSKFATTTQPVLTDPTFRVESHEVYLPQQAKLVQVHRGPGGTKTVTRTRGGIDVARNGAAVTDEEQLHAAALVADCYVVFTFGSSALLERGSGWQIVGSRNLAGEHCTLVAGTMNPGFGISDADGVIAWIGDETKRLRRVQLSLFGLESTAGADVDVTFGDFQPGPFGTEWPRYFNERIRRPIDVQAHEWRMTNLRLRP